MPTVYQRRKPDGTLAKVFTADIWVDGRKFPRSTGRTTRREAEKRAVEIEAELRRDLARRHEPLTLDTLMGRYWREHAAGLPSAPSVKYHIARLIEIMDKDKPLADLSNADVNHYVTTRRKQLAGKSAKPISASTINRELDVLQAAYLKARDSWEHPVRPINWGDHRLEKPGKKDRTLSVEEARRAVALAHTRSVDLADAIELSFYTGMRQNELETLVAARINLAQRYAIVLAKRKARQEYRERLVWLNTAAVALLAERIKPGIDPQAPLFVLTNARKVWEWVRAEIGRSDTRWHDLRHATGSMIADSTHDPLMVQKQLGHTAINTSMAYIHVRDERVLEAVETIPTLTERKVTKLLPAPKPVAKNEAEPPSSATITDLASEKKAQ